MLTTTHITNNRKSLGCNPNVGEEALFAITEKLVRAASWLCQGATPLEAETHSGGRAWAPSFETSRFDACLYMYMYVCM